MKLAGRTAIITGAGRGLGAEIARAFVKEGASVLLCARSVDELEALKDELTPALQDKQAIVIQRADVADAAQVDELFKVAGQAFPRLDILVNNAGVYGPFGGLEDVDVEAWIQALNINLMGTLYGCRAAIPGFKAQRYGKIVNVSGGGATNPLPFISAYAASKAAVVRLTETLAGELRDFSIDVNSIAPGLLATSLQDGLIEAGPERIGPLYDRIKAGVEAGGDSIERAAECCVYLASAESDGVTGRLISARWDPWPFEGDAKADLSSPKSDIYTLRRIQAKDRGQPWP